MGTQSVIIPDLNLLLYATNSQERRHVQAHRWWSMTLSGHVPVGLPWMVVMGFIRITTGPHYSGVPVPVESAMSAIREWRSAECVRMIDPREEHLHIVERLLISRGVGGRHTMDAHLAALAIEHRGTIYSADSDFAEFPSVSWVNPLDEAGAPPALS